jgi:hypothetical protein
MANCLSRALLDQGDIMEDQNPKLLSTTSNLIQIAIAGRYLNREGPLTIAYLNVIERTSASLEVQTEHTIANLSVIQILPDKLRHQNVLEIENLRQIDIFPINTRCDLEKKIEQIEAELRVEKSKARKSKIVSILQGLPQNNDHQSKPEIQQNIDRICKAEDTVAQSFVFSSIFENEIKFQETSLIETQIIKTDAGITMISPNPEDLKRIGELSYSNLLQNLRCAKIQIYIDNGGKTHSKSDPNSSQFSATNHLDETQIDNLAEVKAPLPVLQKTLKNLKSQIEHAEKILDQLGEKLATQVKKIKQFVDKQNEKFDRKELERLKSSSEVTAQLAKVTQQIKFNMGLQSEENKELLKQSQNLFDLSVTATTRLYRIAAQADIHFKQLGGNKGTPFFSRCRAKGCTNEKIYTWYHPGGNNLNHYDTHFTYYLMIYPDDSGNIMCTHCDKSPGSKPIKYWTFSCENHRGEYRPIF